MMHVVAENKRHRPELTEYKHGVKAALMPSISLTLNERLQVLDLSMLSKDSPLKVKFIFNWGLDGSGDHANFHQISKSHFTTKSMMSVWFSINLVKVEDDCGNVVEWRSSDGGANRPQNIRPL